MWTFFPLFWEEGGGELSANVGFHFFFQEHALRASKQSCHSKKKSLFYCGQSKIDGGNNNTFFAILKRREITIFPLIFKGEKGASNLGKYPRGDEKRILFLQQYKKPLLEKVDH